MAADKRDPLLYLKDEQKRCITQHFPFLKVRSRQGMKRKRMEKTKGNKTQKRKRNGDKILKESRTIYTRIIAIEDGA